ncbi:MAG: MoaD family protein [Candidatus Bathyarchaeia archaeon]
MIVSITFFSALSNLVGEKEVQLDASTPLEALNMLKGGFDEKFSEVLFDESGEIKRFINIYVKGRDIRFLNNLETPLIEGDEITLIPAVSGG